MAFAEVVCVCCAHRGHVPANALPRILRCRACRVARMVRRASRTIKSTYVDDGNDVIMDAEAAWRLYEDGPQQAVAPPQCKQPAKAKQRVRKRKGAESA